MFRVIINEFRDLVSAQQQGAIIQIGSYNQPSTTVYTQCFINLQGVSMDKASKHLDEQYFSAKLLKHDDTYKKLTQPVPGGGAIHTKLKLLDGW